MLPLRLPKHCTVHTAHLFNPALALLHEIHDLHCKLMLLCDLEAVCVPAIGIQYRHGTQAAHVLRDFLVRVLVQVQRVVIDHYLSGIQNLVQHDVQIDNLILGPAHIADQPVWRAAPVLAEAPERHVREMLVRQWAGHVHQFVRPEPDRYPGLSEAMPSALAQDP